MSAGIGKLLLLEKLNVCNNFLTILTPAISQLKSLVSLHLANNELSFLPKGMLISKPLLDYIQLASFWKNENTQDTHNDFEVRKAESIKCKPIFDL